MPVVVSVLLLCMALMWSFWASLLPAQGVQGAGAADMRWLYSVNYPPVEVDPLASRVAVLAALLLVIFAMITQAPRIGPWLRRHSWIRACLLLGLLAGFATSEEYVLRHVLEGNPPQWHPDAELQWVGNGGASTNNSQGLNSPEVDPVAPPGTLRVLIIGDSATWGSGVVFQYSYPRVLEAIAGDALAASAAAAAKKAGKAGGAAGGKTGGGASARGAAGGDSPPVRVEVINAAMPGYSSTQSLRFLQRIYGLYHPNLLVFGFNNDSMCIDRYPDSRLISPRPILRIQQALYKSEFYLLVRRLVLNVFVSRVASQGGHRIHSDMVARVPTDEHVANYRAFIRFAREHEMKAAVMIMPSQHGPGYDEADRRLCLEEKVPCIEFWDLFKKLPDNPSDLLPDGIHPTAQGHALMARFLYQRLHAVGYL